jgi:murein DD-endopeptidase MepM/ murein hydrolase activator NlpD
VTVALALLLTATWANGMARAAESGADSQSQTGGVRYDPEPGLQPNDGRLGAIPRSGGTSYDPSARPKPRSRRKSTRRRARRISSRRRARRVAKPKLVAPPPTTGIHAFPVQGPYSFGGADARFGAKRTGHIHQGQDIIASEGTPVVAPRGGVVTWRAYQAEGAGYYLVLDAVDEEYNYVFMHLQRDVLVQVGQRVRTGQQLATVGSTGSTSAPHLHFEAWLGPWYHGGHAIDPLPLLRAWEAGG